LETFSLLEVQTFRRVFMKKILLIGMMLFLVVGMSVFAAPSRQQQIRLATGGATGVYYAYGSVLANILSEKTGNTIIVQNSGASRANIQLMAAGEVEMALVQNDVMDYAWRGVDLFRGEQTRQFRAMAALYGEVCQIVATADSGIRTVADLRGKNVSVGDAGSGTEFNARQILEAHGITFNDIIVQNLGFGPSADAMRDNKIDAAFITSGVPTPAVIDLATGKDIVIIPIDSASAARLAQLYPYYSPAPVPAGSYRGHTQTIQTVAVKATFIVHPGISDDTVYNLTKALFENKALITTGHARGADLDPAYAIAGVSTDFHPGAIRYYREIGVMR
jgi:TRAP transporter TAXI family solute receptor